MRKGVERLVAVDHRERLAKVLTHSVRKVETLFLSELAGVEQLTTDPDAVDGSEHVIQRRGRQDLGGFARKQVRLAELNAGEDAQPLELRPTSLHGIEVADDVDGVLPLVHEGPVRVFGERQCGKPDLDRALAAALHVPAGRVPRPLGMHVHVGRRWHWTRLREARSPACCGRSTKACRLFRQAMHLKHLGGRDHSRQSGLDTSRSKDLLPFVRRGL